MLKPGRWVYTEGRLGIAQEIRGGAVEVHLVNKLRETIGSVVVPVSGVMEAGIQDEKALAKALKKVEEAQS